MENLCTKCGKILKKELEKCPDCKGKTTYAIKKTNKNIVIIVVIVAIILTFGIISIKIISNKFTNFVKDVTKDSIEYINNTTCNKQDINSKLIFEQNILPILKQHNIKYDDYNYNCTKSCTVNSSVGVIDEIIENCYKHYYEIQINTQDRIKIILKEKDNNYNTNQLNIFLQKYNLMSNILNSLKYNKQILYSFNIEEYEYYDSTNNESKTREEIDETIEININENLKDNLSSIIIDNIKDMNNKMSNPSIASFSVRITFKDGYLIDLYQGDLTFTDKQKQKHYYNLANINELLEEIKTIIEKDI